MSELDSSFEFKVESQPSKELSFALFIWRVANSLHELLQFGPHNGPVI